MGKSKDMIGIKGMFRIHITNPDGTLAGDSGWHSNVVVDQGYRYFLCALLGKTTGSSQVGYVALGSGGEPAPSTTALPSELAEAVRKAVAAVTSSTSKAVRFTATFGSSDAFITGAAKDISNIGLYATNTGSNLFAGNTYNSSSCASNQQVNVSYDISFT